MRTTDTRVAWRLIQTAAQFEEWVEGIEPAKERIAVDCETNGLYEWAPDAVLLGVSLAAAGREPVYVVVNDYRHETGEFVGGQIRLANRLADFLRSIKHGTGANYAFDQDWIREHLGVDLCFTFDTQIAWHHSDNPYSQRSYGLKALEKDLLGWTETNDKALEQNVKKNGGKKHELYKADLDALGYYAALDAKATLEGTAVLEPFFKQHNYIDFHHRTARYRDLLRRSTREGMPVDRGALDAWLANATAKLAQLEADFCAVPNIAGAIRCIEAGALSDAMGAYSPGGKGQAALKADPSRHPRFNFDSNTMLADLFYGHCRLPVLETTASGTPAVHKVALQRMNHPAAAILLQRNELKKAMEYAESYREAVNPHTGRLHPAFNVTGTLTGRASGFSPNVHQMPIDETELMACFPVPVGRIGIGGDLTSVEPFFTAYFSDDPTLLKVYRDGLGDIYLDLALDLFPAEAALRELYDPLTKPAEEVKARFKLFRQIAKLVHLASQYGAGGPKIALILTQNGIPTSADEGRRLHRLYWKKFRKVKDLEAGLYELYRQDGFIKNLFGRIIRLPDMWCKDLLNRFIQSTGHDALMAWVFAVDRLATERGLDMVPYILDWHDATYWHCPPSQVEAAEAVLADALAVVNREYELPYPLKMSAKRFSTLAEIK
jgi:DNA polymerase I-like protein with 3'-5' exonuclease and polymerase domains